MRHHFFSVGDRAGLQAGQTNTAHPHQAMQEASFQLMDSSLYESEIVVFCLPSFCVEKNEGGDDGEMK